MNAERPAGAAVVHHGLGTVQITKVVDLVGVFDLHYMLPDAELALIAEHRAWLEPDHIAFDRRELIFSFHSFVLHTPRHNILVDACIGNDKPRNRPEWDRRRGPYLARLSAAGYPPESIDFVLCTHLHADHIGWNTRLHDGRWVPTFPNARYLFARTELDYWQAIDRSDPDPPVNHGSFRDSVQPILDAGRAVVVDNEHALDDEVHLADAAGHTPGSVAVHVRGGGAAAAEAILVGDVIHSPVQCLNPDWNTQFCVDPARSAATRRRLLTEFADTGRLFLTAHFANRSFGEIVSEGNAFRFRSWK